MNPRLLISLSVALLLIGGVFLVEKNKLSKTVTPKPLDTTQQQERAKQLSQTICDTTESDLKDIKEWKVHNNESPKFSFDYPGAWVKDFPERKDGEISIALHDPKTSCFVEGSPALCGVSVSLYPVSNAGESVNVKYLQRMREAEQADQAKIKETCVAGKMAFEITDYLRHEVIFDREGYSFMITAENLGSESQNNKYWSVVDSIRSNLRFDVSSRFSSISDFLSIAEIITIPDVDSSNWKPYANREIGFRTKLPNDWIETLNEGSQVICLGTKDARYVQEESLADCPIQISKRNEIVLVSDLNQWKDKSIPFKLKKVLLFNQELLVVESESNMSIYLKNQSNFLEMRSIVGWPDVQSVFYGVLMNFQAISL